MRQEEPGAAGKGTDPDPPALIAPEPEASPAIAVGAVIAGKYRVDGVLGAGGMGVVVAATHLELLEPRAIKVMHPTVASNAHHVQRFLREARAAARIKSEHVAQVHDVGRLEGGAPYMVMEHLEGVDLDRALQADGRMRVEEAALHALQTCEALAEAHARGLVHRDIKPANLFLTRRSDGSPCIKVLDFGIAKSDDEVSMTASGALLGSPLYMSPEQIQGESDLDARTDVWSLGVVLYELLTGASPFDAKRMIKIFTLIAESRPAPPSEVRPDLPRALDPVVMRCLEKDRARRYRNVAELARALAPFAPGDGRAIADRVARVLQVSTEAPIAEAERPETIGVDPVPRPPLTPLVPRAGVIAAACTILLAAALAALLREKHDEASAAVVPPATSAPIAAAPRATAPASAMTAAATRPVTTTAAVAPLPASASAPKRTSTARPMGKPTAAPTAAPIAAPPEPAWEGVQ